MARPTAVKVLKIGKALNFLRQCCEVEIQAGRVFSPCRDLDDFSLLCRNLCGKAKLLRLEFSRSARARCVPQYQPALTVIAMPCTLTHISFVVTGTQVVH